MHPFPRSHSDNTPPFLNPPRPFPGGLRSSGFAFSSLHRRNEKKKTVSWKSTRDALTVLHRDVLRADIDGTRVAEHAKFGHVILHHFRGAAKSGYHSSVLFTPSRTPPLRKSR